MASYFLRVRTLGRKSGARVTRAAAYRAGERIHDERSSDVFDFCSRQDVVHKEIVLAAEFADQQDMSDGRRVKTRAIKGKRNGGKGQVGLVSDDPSQTNLPLVVNDAESGKGRNTLSTRKAQANAEKDREGR
jgi:hypothetical protein